MFSMLEGNSKNWAAIIAILVVIIFVGTTWLEVQMIGSSCE